MLSGEVSKVSLILHLAVEVVCEARHDATHTLKGLRLGIVAGEEEGAQPGQDGKDEEQNSTSNA